MKVVYIVPMLSPYLVTRFIALGKEDNIDLHIIAETDKSEARNENEWKYGDIEGCHTYLLGSMEKHYQIHNSKGGYNVRESRKFSFGLKKLVNRISPDIVIVCNSTQIFFLSGYKKYKLGIIVEDTPRAAESRRKINKFFKRFMMKKADFYMPFSNDAEEFLKINGIKNNIYRSSWSVNLDFFSDISTEEKRKEEKARLKLGNKRIYLVVSQLIPLKGIGQLISVWNDMPNEFQKKSELHIIGEGPLKDELISLANKNRYNNVYVRGAFQYRDVSHFLQCADIFVLPTLQDVFSLAIIEAVAAGLPILTTIYTGGREMVIPGNNGYVFDCESEASIKEALSKIHIADIETMKNASKKMIQHYSNELVMKRTATIITNIYNGVYQKDGKKNESVSDCNMF